MIRANLSRTNITTKKQLVVFWRQIHSIWEHTMSFLLRHNSRHVIKSKHETSSQFMNRISIVLSRRHDNHEFNDAYVNNAFNYAHSTQSLHHSSQSSQFSLSHQMTQFQSFNSTFERSIWNQMFQLSYLEETSRSWEKISFYVNVKQFNRILKRRVVRQQLKANFRSIIEIRKSYFHESRHKHATRRSKELEEKFLIKEKLKRQEKVVHIDTTNRCQIVKTSIESNRNHMRKTSVDLMIDMSTKNKREQKEEIYDDSRVKESHRFEVRKISSISNESQIHSKDSNHINKAMTTFFYEFEKLKKLHKRYSTIAIDVSQMKSEYQIALSLSNVFQQFS